MRIQHIQNPYTRQLASYTAQVQRGVVQAAIPQLSLYLVRPSGTFQDMFVTCLPPTAGGSYGTTAFSIPQIQTQVLFTQEPGTDMGRILSVTPMLAQPAPFIQSMLAGPGISQKDLSLDTANDKLLGAAINISGNKFSCVPTGATKDTYAGDYLVSDKYGGSLLVGRGQITIKGSALAYTQYSAVTNKITTVASKWEIDTLASLHLLETGVQRFLTASGEVESLGMLPEAQQYPILTWKPGEVQTQLKYHADAGQPIYRTQTIRGGYIRGSYTVTLIPDVTDLLSALGHPIISCTAQLYDGSKIQASANKLRSIKTSNIAGIQQITGDIQARLQALQGSSKRSEDLVAHGSAGGWDITSSIQYFSDDTAEASAQIHTPSTVDLPLKLQTMLSMAQASVFMQEQYTQSELKRMYNAQLQPLAPSIQQSAEWEQQKQGIGQYMSGSPYTDIKNQADGRTIRLFKNNSFILQEPDGSVFIKDGWGSQIRMTNGNIIISSALDTIIRPGRDLINLVPRRAQITSNQQIVLAASQDVKIAAQANVKLTSSVSGKPGYTVLQNKSSLQWQGGSGVIVRSNSNTVITASRDLILSLNDKSTQNKKDGITYGQGLIYIQGGDLIVQASRRVKMAAVQVGLYSVDASVATGELQMISAQASTQDSTNLAAGLELKPSNVSIIASSVALDTSSTIIGKCEDQYNVPIKLFGRAFTLNRGTNISNVHIRGSLQSRDITVQGQIVATGAVVGYSFARLERMPQFVIAGVKDFEKITEQIHQAFKTDLKVGTITHIQQLLQWYTDDFICTKQLYFSAGQKLGFAASVEIPTMCWQVASSTADKALFKPVTAYKTGQSAQKGLSKSYPGSLGWKQGYMSQIDQKTFQISYKDRKLQSSYTTNTLERERQNVEIVGA